MMNKKKESNKIGIKNYILSILILVGGILLVVYIFSWYQVKQEEKYMNSYLISTNTISNQITDLNTLKQVVNEAPNNYFIFIGFRNDSNEYNIEVELKNIIDDYEISDYFYYIDITDKLDDQNYMNSLNNILGTSISNTPAFIYVREGKILNKNIVTNTNKGFNIGNIEKILEIYEYDNING